MMGAEVIDHVSLGVADLAATRDFYDKVFGAFAFDLDGNKIEAVC